MSIFDDGTDLAEEKIVPLQEGIDKAKADVDARNASVDASLVDDLVEAGILGLAEVHALKNCGHSVVVIQDKSFEDPDKMVIRVACNGSPDQFVNGIRDCDYWEEYPIT